MKIETVVEKIKRIKSLMDADKVAIHFSMGDVHHKGLFSLVIHGEDFGNLTRVFIAGEKIKPYSVQLHSHRYPISLTVIKGQVRHHVATTAQWHTHGVALMPEFDYKSPLTGGNGLSYAGERLVNLTDTILPLGANVKMSAEEIHTVSCGKGAMWIVEELGFQKESSTVLGVPFITEDLYKKPEQFQINDQFQLVSRQLTNLINDFKSVTP